MHRLLPNQTMTVNQAKEAAATHAKICVRVPRRWGKTTVSQALCANPSLLGRTWSELNSVVRLDGNQTSSRVPSGEDVGIIVDNADMLDAASLRTLDAQKRVLMFYTRDLTTSVRFHHIVRWFQ